MPLRLLGGPHQALARRLQRNSHVYLPNECVAVTPPARDRAAQCDCECLVMCVTAHASVCTCNARIL